jgi:hypothetical protein
VVVPVDHDVRVAVEVRRLGANELFGVVPDVLVLVGAVVRVGPSDSDVTSAVTFWDGSLVAVVTGADVVAGSSVDGGVIPAMLRVTGDVDGSTLGRTCSTRPLSGANNCATSPMVKAQNAVRDRRRRSGANTEPNRWRRG